MLDQLSGVLPIAGMEAAPAAEQHPAHSLGTHATLGISTQWPSILSKSGDTKMLDQF
jgi:hypothetical protein